MIFPKHRRTQASMKRLYDWFYRLYGIIEHLLHLSIEEVVRVKISQLPGASGKKALEYASGSGLLTLHLARIFRSVEGRDLSTGMISRARSRAKKAGLNLKFSEGNILEPEEPALSFDYVFVSYALHLFDLETEMKILKKLLDISREAVIIIEHNKKWNFLAALIEWIEGSHYNLFLKTDYSIVAQEIGVSGYEEQAIADSTYMVFYK